MTEEEKKIVIDAVNCKFPAQNLTEIYYNIGRALPFTAQRFPDGRVSDWYRNQYVEVVKVEPHGRGGKYGKVYGFYYRNGERADAYENDPENSWCTKDETEPQEIPNCGCGSWALIDIQGEPTTDAVKIMALDDKIGFGKYKDLTLREVIVRDWNYVEWAYSAGRLCIDTDAVIAYHMENRPTLGVEDVMSFGKYKGKTIGEIYKTDVQYLMWLSQNNDSFNLDWEKLRTLQSNI